MDRETMLRLWDELWESGLWAASLSKSVEDLTAAQAAWRPDIPAGERGRRHSIWQIVHHIMYWREVAVRRTMGGPSPTEEETQSRNFDAPLDEREATSGNWRITREKFGESHRLVRAAIADESLSIERFPYVLAHDTYHLGQIMMLRAMQGLKPID
jgi:uncharacterized damage-inducible protein DinB